MVNTVEWNWLKNKLNNKPVYYYLNPINKSMRLTEQIIIFDIDILNDKM